MEDKMICHEIYNWVFNYKFAWLENPFLNDVMMFYQELETFSIAIIGTLKNRPQNMGLKTLQYGQGGPKDINF